MQNRRNFLKLLVGGVAVAAAAPSFPFRVFSFPSEIKVAQPYATYIVGQNAMIAGYADYFNLSDLALASAIDPMVERVAAEMGYKLGRQLDTLVQTTFQPEKKYRFFRDGRASKWIAAPQQAAV